MSRVAIRTLKPFRACFSLSPSTNPLRTAPAQKHDINSARLPPNHHHHSLHHKTSPSSPHPTTTQPSKMPHPLAPLATTFKSLHAPGPLLLPNVYDATSARLIASLPATKALATASYALALAGGTTDAELTLDQHLLLLPPIGAVARSAGLPLTVDLQDGYGERLEEAVRGVLAEEIGAVGINLEDSTGGTWWTWVLRPRGSRGCWRLQRGRGWKTLSYLEAGATTVYILAPPGQLMGEGHVRKIVAELGGRVNLAPRWVKPDGSKFEGGLTSRDLVKLGVARISVGPSLYFAAAKALKDAAGFVFGEED
ncbi:Pyruvate/Phosphoenolpyruvate kinase-like domain-containing protein [Lasiosphaeris hirsuta]|uniref:Pyruvate/Phosphoenolpyruvate kinase-like domain-containing protein n=1 Tax=Lasiosphaeris hirsuta TaxID=260670 RepID=A0AA40DPZ4_9PEZI|nr:Pyruvate/Phosphoenolpyruvate kinase-like domain-containing protein [Lasiosphaeris hirsuta]